MTTALITLLVIAVLVWIGSTIYQQLRYERPREQLRDNPPQRVLAELRTPVGTNNSQERMQKALAYLAGAARASEADRRRGEKVITLEMRVEPGPGTSERASFLLWTDPGAAKPIRRSLVTAYERDLAVLGRDGDPLLEAGLELRAAKKTAALED